MNRPESRPLSHRRPAAVPEFYYGAAYYPEHWPADYLERDAERMTAAGFNAVRMGEFAWHLMEPEEGTFDFSFFDRAVAVLSRHGIRTFLGTPTAAAPRWMTARYPEILRVDGDGRRMRHGSRQHMCENHPVFRAFSRRITRAMAEHFHSCAAVAGWQTDNEIHCHFSECHCPACQEAFRDFLRRRHGSIAELNRAWGNDFWALAFDDFDQIETPLPGRPTHSNPSHRLDYVRFVAASAAAFQREQIEIIRAADPGRLVFHNGIMNNVDYRGQFGRDLDVLGYDLYPLFNGNAEAVRDKHALNADYARSLTGNFIIPEHQAGPGGQPPYMHNTPEPGEMRQLSYVSVARGGDSLLYFRWRTCRFGAEEYWCGLLDHDDVPRRRYHEAARFGAEMRRLGPLLLGTAVEIDCAIASDDFESRAARNAYSLGLPDNGTFTAAFHRRLCRAGYAVGCVHPADDLDGIKLYLLGHCELFRPEWLPALEAYVRGGGILVIGARSGTRNADNQIVAAPLPGVLAELTGITVAEYGRQNDSASRPLSFTLNGRQVQTELWYEKLELRDAEALACWDSRFLAGEPAVSIRPLGQGKVIYAGTMLTEAVADVLLPELIAAAGLRPQLPDLPPEIECVRRTAPDRQLTFLINHSSETVTMKALPPGTTVIGTPEPDFEPYGIKVICRK